MNIVKFSEFLFLNEAMNDTPEQYIKTLLIQIKNKLAKMFEDQATKEEDEEKVNKFSDKQSQEKTNFKELGLELESLELSRYSRTLDNVKLKFSDEEFLYDLLIGIELKEALPKNGKQFKVEDIKECFIKFKKYDKHEPDEVLAEITDNVKIAEISEDLLVSLKLKLDEQSGESDQESFEIELD